MKEQIVLIEVAAFNTETQLAETLRFCDGLAYRTRPSETPANTLYRPFILDPGWTRVDVYSRPGQYGHVTPGEVVLDDSSGTLGAQLINYAFDGRSIVIRIGDRGAAYPSGYVTILNGVMDGQPSFSWGKITLRPADLTAELKRPLQSERYAGNNVLPDGLEGVDDLKGKVKPIVMGFASNMTPILVNTSKLIFHVSIAVDGEYSSVGQARDKGILLSYGGSYASMADLLDDAQAPSAGYYKDYCSAADGTYLRLGSSPVGGLTIDVFSALDSPLTHAQIWKRLLLYAGVDSSNISSADVTALDSALTGTIECAFFNDTDFYTELNKIAISAGCAWYGDEDGVHRLKQWTAPSGTAVASVTSLRTDQIDISDVTGIGDLAPAYLVSVQYGKNWTVQQDSALGGDKTSPSDPVRASYYASLTGLTARVWLADEYRPVQSSDSSLKVASPNAVELKFTSMFTARTYAQAFADNQLAIYRLRRPMTVIAKWLTPDQIDVIRPGVVINVSEERWGFDEGRLMRVAGIQIDRGTGKAQITCWGAVEPLSIVRPYITSPLYGATEVNDEMTITSSAFAYTSGSDTHASTDWEISTGPNGTGTVAFSSLANTVNKTSISLAAGYFSASTTYYLRVRYNGASFAPSDWSVNLKFTTRDVFFPTTIGQSYGGGYYAGKIIINSAIYILVVAPKSTETSLAYKNAATADSGPDNDNDGLINSNWINDANHAAAQYCRALTEGGFTDWYLPSRDELEVAYRNLKPSTNANSTNSNRGDGVANGVNANSSPAGGAYTAGSPAQTSAAVFVTGTGAQAFELTSNYWASTQFAISTDSAWAQNFIIGGQGQFTKTNSNYVRAMRKVAT